MATTSLPLRESDPSKISVPAGRLAVGAAVVALAALVALHVVSPELDPSWRMVSEYALGSHGWLLSTMFVGWGVSSFALLFAIASQVRKVGGKVGLVFLGAAGVGELMASVFDVHQAAMHGLAATIGIPSLPIAAVILSVSLGRTAPWNAARGRLLTTAHLTWLSLALMVATLFIGLSRSGGQPGPGVLVGWPNRLLIAAHLAWTITVAAQALKLATAGARRHAAPRSLAPHA